ncbi:MAG TPA: hypothetical protein VF727_05355 [Allosphingosinicella sp.]|jgi:hypothetical protein
MNERKHEEQTTAGPATDPPGEGDTIDDAAKEAVREIEKRGTGHAGTGDIG